MDHYHIWCDLKAGVSDVEFCEHVDRYLGLLRSEDKIVSHRITRRKLGLGPGTIGEFHIAVEVRNLAQLDQAFGDVSSRANPIEGLHASVNQLVQNLTFALYRDFPDPNRQRGEEQF